MGIARHSPIATGREAHRADFRTVRQARAFELVREESFQEDRQPSANFGRSVGTVELGLFCKEQDFSRRSAESQEVEQKEIVKLVGADRGFRRLGDTIRSSGQQLG